MKIKSFYITENSENFINIKRENETLFTWVDVDEFNEIKKTLDFGVVSVCITYKEITIFVK